MLGNRLSSGFSSAIYICGCPLNCYKQGICICHKVGISVNSITPLNVDIKWLNENTDVCHHCCQLRRQQNIIRSTTLQIAAHVATVI